MARFLLRIEYVGTRYRGWQIQENARTIQGDISEAVSLVTGTQDFELYGSGRTDAGVHALLQVAHLDVDTTNPPEKLRQDLNDSLPPDINILSLDRAARDFHARHGAIGRSYLYQISRRRTAFGKPFVWWVRDRLDVLKMQKAAAGFVGFHDFRGFTAIDPDELSTKVKIETFDVAEVGDLILVRIRGSHFLWKMVRRLVGVLVEVGRGHLTPDAATSLLNNPAGLPAELTAPPSGLYLEQVIYEGEAFDRPLVPAFPVTSTPVSRRHAPPPSWKVDEGPSKREEGSEASRPRRPAVPPRRDDRTSRYVPGQKPRQIDGGERDRSKDHAGSTREGSDGDRARTAGGGTYRKSYPPKRFAEGKARDAYKGHSGGHAGADPGRSGADGGSYRARPADGDPSRKWAVDDGTYRKPYARKPYGEKGGEAPRRSGGTGEGYRKPYAKRPYGEKGGEAPRRSGGTGEGYRKPYAKKPYGEKGGEAPRRSGGTGEGYRKPYAKKPLRRSGPPPRPRGGPRRP